MVQMGDERTYRNQDKGPPRPATPPPLSVILGGGPAGEEESSPAGTWLPHLVRSKTDKHGQRPQRTTACIRPIRHLTGGGGASVCLGVDWAEDHHDLCLVDPDGGILAHPLILEGIRGGGAAACSRC